MTINEETRAALTVEIFEATGLAVDKDDPVVICALMQSHYMHQAQVKVCKEIEDGTQKALQSFQTLIAKTTDQIVRQTSERIVSELQSATTAESNRLKSELAKFADSLTVKLRSAAPQRIIERSEIDPPKITVLKITVTMAIMTMLGGILGARAYAPPELTPRQVKELQFGHQVAKALQHMDKNTQKGLQAALDKSKGKER